MGGGEIARGTFASSGFPECIEYRSHFLDISANDRIIHTYELLLDGICRSQSLARVDLAQADRDTLLTYTEDYIFLVRTGDGSADIAEREGGMRLMLNGLQAVCEATRSRSRPAMSPE